MKVVYVHRQFQSGAYSIETLFGSIANELRKEIEIEIVEYVAGSRMSVLMDAWQLRKINADIYHVTGDIHYIILLLPRRKTILTVHDINHFIFDLKKLKRWIYKWFWLALPIRAAGAVTVISKKTEKHLAGHINLSKKKPIIIENCHSPLFKNVPHLFNSTCPVILQVGTTPNKNVTRLILALRDIHCKLVLIGQLDDEIQQKLRDCGTNYENRVNLSQVELVQAYVDCDIVSFISTAEGFGVPIIEAQASGRPLITSNISPMNEVAGSDACLVSPFDTVSIRDGFLKIIHDNEYRRTVVSTGIKNASQYSPQAISAKYLALYQRLGSAQ